MTSAADGHTDCRPSLERLDSGSMRIAYVTDTYPPELNGVALTVERTVAHLRAHGHVVDLIRPRQPSDRQRDADPHEWLTAGMPIPMYPDLRFGLATAGALRRRFEQMDAQLVHLATPGPLAWRALSAARTLGLATSSDFRTNFHQYSGYYHLGLLESTILSTLRRFHNRSALTFVPTRALRRELAGLGFEHLAVVGRGVDTARFAPSRRRAALRAEWGAADDAPVLLCVGRVAAEKNIEVALRSFERLLRQRADARMVVVGDGPLRSRLEREHPAVRFVGVRRGDALAEHYASADLFVFPSLSETFGNVTLEALASGLPVVAFDAAAAAEHVVHGVNGLLVAPGDENAFADAVCDLGQRPLRLEAMRPYAVEAAGHARWEDILARFEADLQDTVHDHQTHAAATALVA
jgi:glycosyltransferase involved in cell wall biosynthesis